MRQIYYSLIIFSHLKATRFLFLRVFTQLLFVKPARFVCTSPLDYWEILSLRVSKRFLTANKSYYSKGIIPVIKLCRNKIVVQTRFDGNETIFFKPQQVK